jgi:FAD/FMN-containing dehydrogenase
MMRQVPRQTFLRGVLGAIAAGALVGSCRSAAPQSPQATSTVTGPAAPQSPQATSAVTGPRNWSELADSIGGRIILPSNGDYTAAKNLFNTRFDDSTPAAVVTVTSAGDVAKAIGFAAENGLKIAARSGGHSYVGDSAANNAMVIDLRQLPGAITFDAATGLATIPAAADLASVQTALGAHARSIPTGSCPTVGVAGLTLGGGLGADARRCGLTCDALVSATVLLPSGETVTAAPRDHDDLYWALRGGGGGHFGIATSFTLRTFPVSDRDVVTLVFPEGAAAQAILGWHNWLSAADRANWGMVNITGSSSGVRCSVVLATSSGGGPAAASDLGAAIGVAPISATTRTLSHMDFVHYFAGGTDATRPRAVVAGSDIIGEMTSAAAESMVAAASAWQQAESSATTVIESLSGAVTDVDPGGTAFPWRRQAAGVQWYTEPPSLATVDAANSWLGDAHQAVRAHSVGGYINYVESGVPAGRYFGGNLERLTAIRQRYDPDALMYSSVSY